MGKHHTYRHRGSVRGQTVSIGPPPAPVLDIEDYLVTQTAQGNNDSGGQCTLYLSTDEGVTWSLVNQQTWSAEVTWGDPGDLAAELYSCTELGNGVTYKGTSPRSNILDLR